MGGKVSPSAVLVISNGMTKLVNIKNQDGLTKILDMVPDFLNKFSEGKKEQESEKEVLKDEKEASTEEQNGKAVAGNLWRLFAYTIKRGKEKGKDMSRVCGLFLFGVGIGLFLALIFPKSLFMVVMAVLCLLAGYNLFCSCSQK